MTQAVAEIIRELYHPLSAYDFSVIGVELLGIIYKNYLGKTIRLTEKRIKVEENPKVRKVGGRKTIEVEVELGAVTASLANFAPAQNGERLPQIPQNRWVSDAMEMFVRIKLARKPGASTYEVKYQPKLRGSNGDVLNYFIPRIIKEQSQRTLV